MGKNSSNGWIVVFVVVDVDVAVVLVVIHDVIIAQLRPESNNIPSPNRIITAQSCSPQTKHILLIIIFSQIANNPGII